MLDAYQRAYTWIHKHRWKIRCRRKFARNEQKCVNSEKKRNTYVWERETERYSLPYKMHTLRLHSFGSLKLFAAEKNNSSRDRRANILSTHVPLSRSVSWFANMRTEANRKKNQIGKHGKHYILNTFWVTLLSIIVSPVQDQHFFWIDLCFIAPFTQSNEFTSTKKKLRLFFQ